MLRAATSNVTGRRRAGLRVRRWYHCQVQVRRAICDGDVRAVRCGRTADTYGYEEVTHGLTTLGCTSS